MQSIITMYSLNNRLRASAIHLTISLGVAALAAMLVFGLWYPFPYREISGGREMFFLILVVDIVIGPFITLVIFNRTKSNRHLAIDFFIVGFLQLAALSYGLWTVFFARPVHLVFEFHRIAVVHAVDVSSTLLSQAPPELQALPLTGPTMLSLRPFRTSDEQINSTLQAISGVSQAAQPGLWQSYNAGRTDILNEAKPLIQLKSRHPEQVVAIDNAVAKTGLQYDDLSYLPLLARNNAWTVLIDRITALPVGYLPVDSF